MKLLRPIILNTIDSILMNAEHKESDIASLNNIYDHLHETQNAFLIDNIVFGHFIHLLTDNEVKRDTKLLQTIKDQLSGEKPYIQTYALRYPFVELLSGEIMDAYQELLSMYDYVTRKVNNSKVEEIPKNYSELRENLFLRYGRIKAKVIPDLLVIQACHTLLSLPDDQRSFDVMDVFSSIYPKPTITAIETQLSYVQGILNKLLGDEVLYIEVCILPDGNYMINLR